MKPSKKIKKDFAKLSLAAHKKLKGKISITQKGSVRTKDDLAIYYTPGVGAVSTYLSENKAKVRDYTMKGNLVAVISDGSAVLGLGNIGPEGAYPVMEGKAMLLKSLAGIDAMPILLSTQHPDAIVAAVKAIAPTFGGIILEDIAAPQCFEIERRLQEDLDIPVIHDDQKGTAVVVLAGIINALKVAKKSPSKARVVISGAGAAGISIAHFLGAYGITNILVCDRMGVIYRTRPALSPEKRALAESTNPGNIGGGLADALRNADVFIGVSSAGLVTEEMVRTMAPRAIVFALANPTPEIMPDIALRAGALVVATGRSDFPNQVNNALGFPGIFRGALDNDVTDITDAMLIQAAKNLAGMIKKPSAQRVLPDALDKKAVKAVARGIK
jgi:malate dehydrogenase (oxaloacetate-decarboxylating)